VHTSGSPARGYPNCHFAHDSLGFPVLLRCTISTFLRPASSPPWPACSNLAASVSWLASPLLARFGFRYDEPKLMLFGTRRTLWKLRSRQGKANRIFDRLVKESGKSADDCSGEDWYADYMIECIEVEALATAVTDELLSQAQALYLPVPAYGDNEKWDSDHAISSPTKLLKPEVMTELRAAIRKETSRTTGGGRMVVEGRRWVYRDFNGARWRTHRPDRGVEEVGCAARDLY
jgi:hypothetical protein